MAKVNPDQMNIGTSLVGDMYANMAQELMIRMIKRLKKRGAWDLQKNPYAWQLEKLNDMHMLNAENIKYIAQQSGIAEKQLRYVIQNEGLKVYEDTSEQLAEETGSAVPPTNGVQDTLQAYADQTFRDIGNFVNQTLLSTNLGENGAMRVYKSIIEQTTAEVATGLKSPDMALRDTVTKWVDKGIPSSFTDKGGHTWSIERYARTVINSTTSRVFRQMRTQAADDLGVDTFYMSAHPAARPACASIQGHVVTKAKKGFESNDPDVGYVASLYDHGYGEPGGTMGINCHHYLTPFVIGVNRVPDDPVPSPEEAVANGEKQARQRAYERAIVKSKNQLEAAKALGDKPLMRKHQDDLTRYRKGLRNLIDENEFLHRDYSRERASKNQQLTRTLTEMQKERIQNSYDAMKNVLGTRAPSFDEYRNIRNKPDQLNDLSNDYKTVKYIRSKSNREITSDEQRKVAEEAYFNFKKDGVLLSDHAVSRYADRMRRKSSKASQKARNGQVQYNYQSVLALAKSAPNYIDVENGRVVRFDGKLALVEERDGSKIVTLMRRDTSKPYHPEKGTGWKPL